jgi:lipopolysaccharide export system protein LptA
LKKRKNRLLKSKFIVSATHLFLALTLLAGSALAERADKQKPIQLEAESVVFDDVRQITVVQGPATMTKGTIVIRAARLEIREDQFGNQSSLATAKAGERVFFRQKREGLDEFMEGEAERIDYDGKQDVVKLVGKAVMRRYRGATLVDESVAASIVFNNITETLSVNGAPATAAAPGQRVRMMLTPNIRQPLPAASTGSAAMPALRPATASTQPAQ